MNVRERKLITLFATALLAVAVAIVIVTPPANQYEISLYGAYPIYFWIALVGAMFTAGVVVLASAGAPDDRSWVFGVVVMLLSNVLLLSLPLARGYYMYVRGDPLSHLGYIRDILASGDIGGNLYPPLHLLAIAVAEATGLELTTIAMVVPLGFLLLYFGSMFHLLVHLLDSRQRILFGLPFVFMPVLRYAHPEFRPFGMSLMLLPLVFYLLIRSQRAPVARIRAVFVVVLVTTLLYHPLTALFVIGIFGIWLAARHVSVVRVDISTPTNVLSLSAVVFLAWYSNFAGIILRFERVYAALFGTSEGEAPIDGYTGVIESASPSLVDLLRVGTFKFGLEGILFALGFAFIAVALSFALRGDSIDSYISMLATTLAVFSLGGLAFLVFDLIVPHVRPFQIAKISGVVLAGQLFYLLRGRVRWIHERPRLRTGVVAVAIVTLLLLTTLSTIGVHHSPIESESNQQVTEMKFEGTAWLTEYGTATDSLLQAGVVHYRVSSALYGTQAEVNPPLTSLPPPRFNYTEYDTLGDSYTEDQYLTISRQARIVYPELFPDYRDSWRYTPGNFARLERDRTVSRIYDNGDSTHYLVDGTAPETNVADEQP
jgi:hypothetical protein